MKTINVPILSPPWQSFVMNSFCLTFISKAGIKLLLLLLLLIFPLFGFSQQVSIKVKEYSGSSFISSTSDCVENEFEFKVICQGFAANTTITAYLVEFSSNIKSGNGVTDANGDVDIIIKFTFNSAGAHYIKAKVGSVNSSGTYDEAIAIANSPSNVNLTLSPPGGVYCANTSLSVTSNQFEFGGSGTWTGGPSGSSQGPVSFQIENHTGPSSKSHTITFTGTDANNCPDKTASISITINPAPNVQLAASSLTLCSPTSSGNINSVTNDKVTITVTKNANSTISWAPVANMSFISGTPTSISESRDYFYNTFVPANTVSTISVAGTSPQGCIDQPSNKNISVSSRETPNANFTFPAGIISNVVPFTNNTLFTPGGTIEYSWDFGDGNTIAFGGSASPTHSYTVTNFPTAFNVIMCARLINGGCQTCTTKVVSIDAQPTASFSSLSDYCLKSDGNGGTQNNITFVNTTTSNQAGALSSFIYEWNFGDGSSNYITTGLTNATHSYANAGTYTCVLTVKNASNTATSVFTKVININPHPIFNGTTDYLVTTGHCVDRSIEFKMGTFSSVSNSNFPLKWSMDYDGNNTNGSNSDGFDAYYTATNSTGFSPLQAPFYYTHTSSGTITIKGRLEITTTGCATTFTESFTIDPTPTTSIAFSPNVGGMCINTTSPVSISSTTSGSVYDWEYIPPSNAVWRPSTQSFYPTGTMLELGTADLNLKIQNSYGCWSDVVSSSFDIWEAPDPDFTNTTVCHLNDAATAFTNTTTGPQNTYNWDFDDNSSASTLQNPSHDFSGPGSYDVMLTVTENTHSCTESITKTVTVKPNPTVDFSFSAIQCEQQAVTFTDNSTLSGNTIASRFWDWDDGTNSTTSNQTQDHTFTPTFPGSTTTVNYDVILTSTASNGCNDVKTKTITIKKRPAQPTLSVATNSQNHTNTICEGETYTLNASPSSGYNFEWFYNGNSMGAYYNNYYTSTGVGPLPDLRPYSVRITDGNGCYNTSSTSYINVKHVNTYISYQNGYTVLCPNSTVELTGFLPHQVQSYEWRKAPYDPNTQTFGTYSTVGSNIKTHLVDNLNEGRYKYIGRVAISGGDDCVDESDEIDVINAIPLALNYSGVVNIDINNPQVLMHVTQTYPTYSTFKWYRNDIEVSTLSIYQVTKPGKYYLVAFGSCGIEKSNVVEFRYDCGSPGYNPNYSGTQNFNSGAAVNLNPGTVTPGIVLMNGDWNVSAGTTLNISGLTIVSSNCAKINVTNGTLNLTNTNLVGCDEWNGVVIDGTGSSLNMSGGSISEAVVGVTSKNRGTLSITQAEFDNNMMHVGYSANGTLNSSVVSFNKFGNLNLNTPTCTHPEFPGWNYVNQPMVYLEGVTGPSIVGNTFICNNTNNAILIDGIQSYQSNNIALTNNLDNGFLSNGINVIEGNAVNVSDNTFGFRFTTPLDLFYSRTGWFKSGLLLKDIQGSTIDRNLITYADQGIAFFQNTSIPKTVSNISRNRIENCNWGLVTATKENPATSVVPYQNSSTQTIYLQVNCNTFNNNNYGWIGTGTYNADQGTSSLSSGNTFSNTTNWNVCVADVNRNYFWYTSNSSENPYAGSLTPISLDGIAINSTNYITICFNPSSSGLPNSCSNKRSIAQQTNIDQTEGISKGIEVGSYPNPFNEVIRLQANGLNLNESYRIQIFDLSGKLIFFQSIILTEQLDVEINSVDWLPGMYIIQLLSESGSLYNEKIIKTGF